MGVFMPGVCRGVEEGAEAMTEKMDYESTEFLKLREDLRDYILALEELWDEIEMFSKKWRMPPGDRGSLEVRMGKCLQMRGRLIREE